MFAVQNGVVTYNGVPTVDLSPEQVRRMYGTAGDILHDPRYRVMAQVGHGDAGFTEEEQVDSEAAQRLYRDGQWYRQVGPMHSVGGEGEVSDPSNIVWDDELGYITPMSNVREYNDTVFTPAMMLAAGGMLGAIGMAGGFSGLLGGAGSGGLGAVSGLEPITLPALEGAAPTLASIEGLGTAAGAASGFPAGAGIAGPALETAGVATGALDGVAASAAGSGAAAEGLSSGLFPPGAGPGVGGPLLETAGVSSNVPWYTQLMANAAANPMMATRALLGGANLINTLTNKPDSGSSLLGGDASGVPVPAFNPAGLLSGYKPMQFDPVPFMSGRYGG